MFRELFDILRDRIYRSMCSARISPIKSGTCSQNLYKVSLYSLCVVVAYLCACFKNWLIASLVGVLAPVIAFWGNMTNRHYRYNRYNCQSHVFLLKKKRGTLHLIINSFFKSVKTNFGPMSSSSLPTRQPSARIAIIHRAGRLFNPDTFLVPARILLR